MTLNEIVPWLFARQTGGIRWGLERTERLLAGVGDPHRRFHSILIGGTNGKGSVAAMCDSALRAMGGLRVGLYTSPHLVSFTERIRIDGRPIDSAALARVAERLRPAIEESGASFFEATTAMAFLAMAEAGVEVAVVEVGLGGRLDATNVLSPLVTAVTNVAMDHSEYLGDALESIAREKAGIFKAGVPAIVGVEDPELVEIFAARAAQVGAPFHRLQEMARVEDVSTGSDGTALWVRSRRWGERRLRVPLPGLHQAWNAAMAAELLGMLPSGFSPGWSSVESGLAAVRWPGRLQVETIRGTTWVFDVAHNPAGAAALAAALPEMGLGRPLVAVVGILGDKAWREMLRPVGACADAMVLTVPSSAPASRQWDLDEVARWAAAELSIPVRAIRRLDQALERAVTLGPHGTVVVTGSVHTVGDAMVVLGVDGLGGGVGSF